MAYRLHQGTTGDNPEIIIVGCGGTGGFAADHICRLFTGRPAKIVLIDHDRVERHNVLRQNFTTNEIGKFKSQTLAERLAQAYERPICYSTLPFGSGNSDLGLENRSSLILGCVDNAEARREIANCLTTAFIYRSPAWWIDVGNGKDWGQVLIGNTTEEQLLKNGFKNWGICDYLPAPTMQRPDLLTSIPDEPPDTDCAAALDLTDQDPTINGIMALHAVHTVRRIVAGTCTYMSQYVNLEEGSIVSTPASPENVARITGLNMKIPTENDKDDEDEYDEDEA